MVTKAELRIKLELRSTPIKAIKSIFQARPGKPSKPIGAKPINIYIIGVAAFQTNLKREENTFFTTFLYKINRLIAKYTLKEGQLGPYN